MQAFPLGIVSTTLNATVGMVSLEVAQKSSSQSDGSKQHTMKSSSENGAKTVLSWDLGQDLLRHTTETDRPAWQHAKLEGLISFAGVEAFSSSNASSTQYDAPLDQRLSASPSLLQLYSSVGGHRNGGRGTDAFCESGRNSYGIFDFEVCTVAHSKDTGAHAPNVSPLRKPLYDGDSLHGETRQPPGTASGLDIDPNVVVVQDIQHLYSSTQRAVRQAESMHFAHQPSNVTGSGQESNGGSISKLFAAVAGAVKSRLLPDSSLSGPVRRYLAFL